MRLVLTVPDLVATSGGPSRSVPALATALAQAGAEVEIFTRDDPDGAPPRLAPDPALVRTHAVRVPAGRWRDLRVVPPLRQALRARLARGDVDLLHDAGIWLPSNHVAAAEARRARVPYVISPRGMLEPWAVGFRAWKKRLAWTLFQGRDVAGAAALHATAAAEADGFRALGLTQRIITLPNGVELPPPGEPIPPAAGEPRTALFLSRLHPKKGLVELVQAWAAVRPPGWRLRLIGHDNTGHTPEVEAAIRAAGVADSVRVEPPVEGAERWRTYRSAELFVLPSYSENFGLVVAEALACGVPVITTTATPWAGLVERRAGWWIECGRDPLVPALCEATGLPGEALRAMGERGATWVREEFSWERIGRAMLAAYRDLR
ncbi:MAG: glycosyltransferase [Verrucomicrobia bacterium]|nr:glycosyltransferase [Verrucomicrobiota bacterium]